MSQLLPVLHYSHLRRGLTAQASLSLESQQAIDRICTDFEDHWGTEHASSIEQLVEQAEVDLRAPLLLQLLLVELEIQASLDRPLIEQAMLARFPQYEEIVQAGFALFSANQSDDLAGLESPSNDPSDSRFLLGDTNCFANPSLCFAAESADAHQARYIRQSELARGGMGVVYRGWDKVLKRQVAIKVIDASLVRDREARLRFSRESRICGNLQHPNVVPVYDVGKTETGLDCFVMKLVNGRTLAEWLQHNRAQFKSQTSNRLAEQERDWASALPLFMQIARAIGSAHRIGIIHRDIKPANVMLAEHGEVYVMDWGLSGGVGADSSDPLQPATASHAATTSSSSLQRNGCSSRVAGSAHVSSQSLAAHGSSLVSSLTLGGKIFGTLRYMPPELEDVHANRATPQVDVYSLGAMLCEFLVGKTPRQLFEHASPHEHFELLYQHLGQAGFDSDLNRIISRCIHHHPQARFESADDLVSELETYQQQTFQRARDAELAANTAIHNANAAKWRWRAFGVLSMGLATVLILAVWTRQRVESLHQLRAADALHAFERADDAFLDACEAGDLDRSRWEEASRIYDSIQTMIAAANDLELKERNRQLGKQLRLFQSISQAPKFRFDSELQQFTAADFMNRLVTALDEFGIGPEHHSPEAACQQLQRLDVPVQKLITSQLIENIRSNHLQGQQWWFDVAEQMEEAALGSTLYRAVLDNDLPALQSFVDHGQLQDLSPAVQAVLANALQQAKDLPRAEQVYRAALAQHPTNFALTTNFGDFLQHYPPMRPVEALEYFGIAAAIDRNEGSLINLVTCMLECNLDDRAFELLEGCDGIQTLQIEPLIRMAYRAQLAGNYDAAERLLDSLQQRAEKLHLVYLRQSEVKLAQGSLLSARQLAEQAALIGHDDPDFMPEVYSQFMALRLITQAIAGLEELIAAHGESFNSLFELARAYQMLEDYHQAERLYRKCLALEPNHPFACCNLGFTLERMERRNEAIEMLQIGHQHGRTAIYWNHDTASWLNVVRQRSHASTHLVQSIAAAKAQRNPSHIYLLIVNHLRPSKRFDEAYELLKQVPENAADSKFWLIAASIAADAIAQQTQAPHSHDDHDGHGDLATLPPEMVEDLTVWLERATEQMIVSPRSCDGCQYLLFAFREATQQLGFKTLRSADFAARLPENTQLVLANFWNTLNKRVVELEHDSH